MEDEYEKKVLAFLEAINCETGEERLYLKSRDNPDYCPGADDLEVWKSVWENSVGNYEAAKEFFRPIILEEIQNH